MTIEGSVAAAMARYVSEAGATHVFTYPGDPIIPFLEALRRGGTEVVLGRREGTAGFMAEGYSQAVGRIGVVASTLGPGSTALVNSVAAAQWDRVPMLAVSGQIETAREQFFTHQVVDHGRLFAPVTKWAGRVEPKAVHPTMRKSLRTATAERPGAVHLSVASDAFIAPAPVADVALPPSYSTAGPLQVYRGPNDPDPVALLRSAHRPVVVAGIGATRAGAGDELLALARTVGVPVVVTAMAKGVVPESNPWFAGVLDMACNDVMWRLLADSDLVVAVGFDAVELIKPWSLQVPVLHVDAVPNTDQIYPAAVELVGDIRGGIRWLVDDWQGEARWNEEEVAAHRRALRSAYYSGRVPGALNPTDVLDGVREAMPESTVVSCDVGSHKLLVGQGWTTHHPRGVLMTNGLSSMGFGLPAAIGAMLARPGVPVAALVGDGGFAMAATELRLAASLQLPLVVVVFVDRSLNRIELKQSVLGYPSTATRIEATDLVRLAEAMECDGVRVETRTELDKALAGRSGMRPLVVEAVIDPAQYAAQF